MTATISQLSEELLARVKSTETFEHRGFSIFDLDDLDQLGKAGAGFPMAAVRYEGSSVQEKHTDRPSSGSARAQTLDVAFSIVIAMEYRATSGEDTKVYAMDLLQETRSAVMGYQGVNTRPWTLLLEEPVDGDVEGVIFYGQLWKTILPIVGQFRQS